MNYIPAKLSLTPDLDAAAKPVASVSLRRNVSWVVLGNVLFGLGNACMIVMLAKLGNPEMVGLFALGLAVSVPVTEFAKLGLRRVIVTDAKGEYGFGQYLALRVLTCILAVLAVVCVVYLTGYRGVTAMVIIAVAVSKAFDSLSDIVYGLLQRQERMNLIAFSMILRTVLSVVAMGITVYITRDVLDGVLAMGAAWALIFFFFDYPLSRRIASQTSGGKDLASNYCPPIATTAGASSGSAADQTHSRRLRNMAAPLFRLALMSSPLGIALMLSQLNLNIPRYFVEWELGVDQLGLFAACAYLVQAGALVVNSLGQAGCPRLSRHFADADVRSFRVLLRRLLWLSVLPGVVGLLGSLAFGRYGLLIFYGPEYAEKANLLQWLFAAGVIQYLTMTLGHAMAAARMFRSQALVLGLRSIVTTVACFALVPKFGLLGAAWAFGGALLLQLFFYWFALQHAFRDR